MPRKPSSLIGSFTTGGWLALTRIVTSSAAERPVSSVTVNRKTSSRVPVVAGAVKVGARFEVSLRVTVPPEVWVQAAVSTASASGSVATPSSVTVLPVGTANWSSPALAAGGSGTGVTVTVAVAAAAESASAMSRTVNVKVAAPA